MDVGAADTELDDSERLLSAAGDLDLSYTFISFLRQILLGIIFAPEWLGSTSTIWVDCVFAQ